MPNIIIRQEVIFPYPWPGSAPAAEAPAPAANAPRPTAEQGLAAYKAAADDSNPKFRTSHFISTPGGAYPCEGTAYPTISSQGYIRVTGHSDCDGNGPKQLAAKCFLAEQSTASIEPDGSWGLLAAGAEQYLNPDWALDVKIATLNGCNYLYVLAQFEGQDEWLCDNCEFPLNQSGSDPLRAVLTARRSAPPAQREAREAQHEAPPAQREAPPPGTFIAEVAKGSSSSESMSIPLTYDRFCSTPDQPVWRSCPRQSEGEWILKACRYGTRLIGILTSRGDAERIWFADRFDLAASNAMLQEGGRGSTVRVTPG